MTPLVTKAIKVAATAHAGQTRKGSQTPYVAHPFGVMAYAAEVTQDENVLAAALLHDVLEDVPAETYDEACMREDFGDRVVALVKAVTENERTADERATWQSRKNAYLAHLEEADPDALIVSLADKTHNLAAILEDFRQKGDSFWDIFNAGVERQVWCYGAVADVLNRRMEETALLRRYNQLVEELRQATAS